MDFLSQSALIASAVVLFVTQALKYVPAEFTTRYAVWVNIILSFIGTLVISGVPNFTGNFGAFFIQWLVIAVVAAIAYTQLLKKAVVSPVK